MRKSCGSALALLGLALCGAAVLASPAVAAKPECSVENLPPQKRTYNSNTYINPLGTAIADAKSGDTLQVVGTCRGNFVIDKSLTLRGRATSIQLDSLDGNGIGTVLSIRGGPTLAHAITVDIRDLRIRNGEVGMSRSGYPVDSAYSNVTLTHSTVSDNASYGVRDSAFTGDTTCRGALTLTRSTVQRNAAGGILMGNQCTPYTFNYSAVTDNTGIGISAATEFLAFAGGVTLDHSTVSRNDVGISWSRGGALTIHGSTVNDNSGAGIDYRSRGGAGPVIDNSMIRGNRGRGIFVSTTTLTLTDSTVSGNSTDGDGGGIYSNADSFLTRTSVSGNTAGGSGGGIYNSADSGQGTLTLVGSTVSGNSAGIAGGGIFSGIGASVIMDAASSACGNSPDDC
jgi:putative cofactor-binding repeat protein